MVSDNMANGHSAANKKQKLILAIECTAHTFGAAVADIDYNILSNERDILKDDKGGLIPIRILEHHVEVSREIIQKALDDAGVSLKDIEFIAVSNSPGMGHALRTGNIIAKTLSMKHNIPLIPVNHSLSHLTSAMVHSNGKNTTLMYAAGANTQIYNYSKGRMMLVVETLDIGIGHLLDIIARELGFGFPGGPVIEKIAAEYNEKNDGIIELPYNVKGMDVVFGGLFTKVKNMITEHKEVASFNEDSADNLTGKLCFSVQEYSFAALLEATERAASLNNSNNIAVIGGVALNKKFQEMSKSLCEQKNVRLIIPEKNLLPDNAAMIALEAARKIKDKKNGNTSRRSSTFIFSKSQSLKIKPYERLQENFSYKM